MTDVCSFMLVCMLVCICFTGRNINPIFSLKFRKFTLLQNEQFGNICSLTKILKKLLIIWTNKFRICPADLNSFFAFYLNFSPDIIIFCIKCILEAILIFCWTFFHIKYIKIHWYNFFYLMQILYFSSELIIFLQILITLEYISIYTYKQVSYSAINK